MAGGQSRSGSSQLPPAQPVPQRRKQRWRPLQLGHTTQQLIYAEPLPLETSIQNPYWRLLWAQVALPVSFLVPGTEGRKQLIELRRSRDQASFDRFGGLTSFSEADRYGWIG